MNSKLQQKPIQPNEGMHHDAAGYLAAILPELSRIAQTSHLVALSEQIDRAAALAQKALRKENPVRPLQR